MRRTGNEYNLDAAESLPDVLGSRWQQPFTCAILPPTCALQRPRLIYAAVTPQRVAIPAPFHYLAPAATALILLLALSLAPGYV